MPRPLRYEWDVRIARYRDRQTGRLVADAQIRRAIDTVLRNDQQRVRLLADDVRAGRISRQEWALEMRQVVTEVHLYSGAAAAGGWKNLDAQSYGQIGAAVREQYGFLDQFTADVNAGLPLDGSFTRRSLMYVQAGRRTFHAAQTSLKADQGFTEERNILDLEAFHCLGPTGCPAQTALEWQPIGTLVPIGERLCLTNCRCRLEFRKTA